MGGEYALAPDEKELVSALRQNSRASLRAIAKRLGMPPSTAHDRVKRLCERGILRHTTLVDFAKLGHSRLLIGIKATANGLHRIQAFLQNSGCVNNAHRTEGTFDYITEVVAPSSEQAANFAEMARQIPGVLHLEELKIIQDIQKEVSLPGSELRQRQCETKTGG